MWQKRKVTSGGKSAIFFDHGRKGEEEASATVSAGGKTKDR
jgi:hypothetical protein